MPSKIFEALGMRRPILIGVDGDARRLVNASGGGWSMPPEDEQALVDQIMHAMEHPEERAAMGERGREFVLEHFDRDKLANDYLEILDALMTGVKVPSHEPAYT